MPRASYTSLVQRAFAGGELAPELGLRADLVKYATGLLACRNFLIQRQGGATNRPGSYKLAETKLSGSSSAALEPFIFAAADESYVIECGDLYFRFYWHGALVTVAAAAYDNAHQYLQGDTAASGGVTYYAVQDTLGHAPPNATYWYALTGTVYEVPTAYTAGAFKSPARACFAQSGDVITITHLNHPPRELRRYARTRWALTTVVTTPPIAAPTTVAFTPGTPAPVPPPDGTYIGYQVTAVDANGKESVGSLIVPTASAQEKVTTGSVANPNVITWVAAAGAASYNIYKDVGGTGVYGYVWSVAAPAVTYSEPGLTPNSNRVPPVARALFDAVNTYPAVSCTYQQRRLFAGTHTDRELVEASVTGAPASFGMHTPIQDDDSVSFKLAGVGVHPVAHIIPLERLVMLTDSSAWTIDGDDTGAITPTNINPHQHGYIGAADVPPVTIGAAVLYVQLQNKIVRDLRYNRSQDGESLLGGRDLSVLAAHLTKHYGITDLDFAANPHSIVWAVREDGVLLGLTYLPEEDVWGWHRHDTATAAGASIVESVCVIPESGQDAVYLVVKRTINGATKRFVEQLASRDYVELKDACFVDCAVRVVNTSPKTSVTGLLHLEGETVSVFADGAAHRLSDGKTLKTYKVAGGTITLQSAATVVQVGLPIVAELETLDLDVSGSALRGMTKRVVNLALLVLDSMLGCFVGKDRDHLVRLDRKGYQTSTLLSELVDVNAPTAYTTSGRMVVRHTDPTPLTVLGVIPTMDVGG
jgi:hypothetical protein